MFSLECWGCREEGYPAQVMEVRILLEMMLARLRRAKAVQRNRNGGDRRKMSRYLEKLVSGGFMYSKPENKM